MTESVDPKKVLKEFVSRYPTQKEAAKALRVSGPFLSDMLRGRRDISDRMIRKLGLRIVVVALAAQE